MTGYLIRISHSKVARLAIVAVLVMATTGFCDDPYSPDRWLPGD